MVGRTFRMTTPGFALALRALVAEHGAPNRFTAREVAEYLSVAPGMATAYGRRYVAPHGVLWRYAEEGPPAPWLVTYERGVFTVRAMPEGAGQGATEGAAVR